MQIASSKGQSSCTDIVPRLAMTGNEIDLGLVCSHGTQLWIRMTKVEAIELCEKLLKFYLESLIVPDDFQ